MTHMGQRLREAIEAWGSIRSFSEQMQLRGVPGSTYPTVDSYLKGESSPRLDFIQEAADLLGVSPAELAFGRDHQIAIESEGDLDKELGERFPYYKGLRPDAKYALGFTVLRIAQDIAWRYPDADAAALRRKDEEYIGEIGGFVERMVRLFYNPTTGPESQRLEDFIISIALGVRRLIPPATARGGERTVQAQADGESPSA